MPACGGSDVLLLITPDESVHGADAVPFSKPVFAEQLRSAAAATGRDCHRRRLRVLRAPPLSVTVSVTVYVPLSAYVWLGLVTAVEVPPSPNVHERDEIVPSGSVDESVKFAVRRRRS